ncbi:DEAD/DEAH box helicase [Paenibacillus sp. MCAF9]|uniref:DEAD/DEAH box helicase n=1 Tax=Paenibacillus sp. MCAF9 TaxID=3233046 RepID=UPI003F9CBC76
MKTAKTFGTVLKRFQQDAVNNGTAVLTRCLIELSKLDKESKNFRENRNLIIGDVGALLFEAPTGSGKTLMAGHVAENLSQLHNTKGLPRIIWFWFAPFAGLIDQAVRTIRTEFSSLRPKDPVVDRDVYDLKSGDVFVTTWSSVAVSNELSRKTRTSTESLLSIDDLVVFARSQGFIIGVIIDEAHHTFRGQTQAFSFYNSVLSPELTMLVTATPRDKDILSFTKATGVSNLRRITVSRQQAIEDRLIKQGVKVAVFKAPSNVQSLIDFKRTALKQGVATHNRLKRALIEAGQTVVPLLLVQVDSEEGSVEQTVNWLKEMGFRTEGEEGLIRSHTAAEPDPYLSTIAADENVEVLIFKMAVATGFDAPRAFTLVSFRPNRDDDFGVQIVGRILRVDRRLQVVDKLPNELNFGYVFLSDNTSQTGLTSAAQRINQVKDELASVTTNVTVIPIDIPEMELTQKGDSTFLTFNVSKEEYIFEEPQNTGVKENTETYSNNINDSERELESILVFPNDLSQSNSLLTIEDHFQEVLFQEWGFIDLNTADNIKKIKPNGFRYDINTSLSSPRIFSRAMLSLNNIDIVNHIVSQFRFDNDSLLVAQQNATRIIKEEIEIFGNLKERPEEIRADLAQKEIDARAQLTLFTADDFDVIDMRELYTALANQLRVEVEKKGIDDFFNTDEKLRSGLHKILALRPQQLKLAISETVAKYTVRKDSEPIPDYIFSDEPLAPSRLNLYGVFPDDLNSWERPFAEYLDDDVSDTVLWWHRNPPRKPYSVTMPLPGQPDFYPDFVVGINGRNRGEGILLMETKRVINDQERNALVKAQAVHPEYGKVMMIFWQEKREWHVVEYDPKTDKNFLDRVLRMDLMNTY